MMHFTMTSTSQAIRNTTKKRKKPTTKRSRKLERQINALISGITRETYSNGMFTPATTTNQNVILTCNNISATAPYNSGLINTLADSAMLHWVRIKGFVNVSASMGPGPPTGHALFRILVIDHILPFTTASVTGVVPPVTDVIPTGTLFGLPLQSDILKGRAKILSDKLFDLGQLCNYFSNGPQHAAIDYVVKLNVKQTYKAPCTAAYPGGHYDSTIEAGQVTKHLICAHWMTFNFFGSIATVYGEIKRRMSYTA